MVEATSPSFKTILQEAEALSMQSMDHTEILYNGTSWVTVLIVQFELYAFSHVALCMHQSSFSEF